MNLLVLGDCHIGANLSYGKVIPGLDGNSKISDQINLLYYVLDAAVENDVTDIFLTGDVFEEPKPYFILIKLLISWIKKCNDYNIKIHITRGNHDILRLGSTYSSPLDIIEEAELDNVTVYKNFDTVFIGKTGITLMPFRDRKSLNLDSNIKAVEHIKDLLAYELSTIPETYHKIVISHFALEGSIFVGNEIDDISNELFCPLSMFNDYDYVWMGHVHKYQVLNKKPVIAHIGSMDISNFGETDQKKNIIIFNTETSDYKVLELPIRPLKKIVLDLPKDELNSTEFILKELKDLDLENSTVKIELNVVTLETKPINKAKIEEFLYSKKVFNIINISELKQLQVLKKEAVLENKISTKIDCVSAIKEYAKLYIDKDKVSKFLEISMEIYNEVN